MLATLATTIPGLSCAVGTPERKILDAVAEAISEAYVDQYLVGSLMDIDTKGGLELEQFVGIFGFGRLQGKAATGTVRITAQLPSTSDATFQASTQFYTTPGLAGLPLQLYYASTQSVVLVAGNTTCDIPVQCTTVGAIGNVPPDSVTYGASTLGGSACTNLAAMTGGVDIETDSELRQRFKDTMLRNISGTSDWYEALCQQNTNVSRVVVFGPLSLYRTQISVPSTTLVLPVNQDVKYAWCLTPNTRVLTEELEWIPVGSLGVGDRLIGFDEHAPAGRGKKRSWKRAEVTATSVFKSPTFRVQTTGPTVTCTADHLWLVAPQSNNAARWVKTKDLKAGDRIRHITPWGSNDSFECGYVAGIFDGEGSVPSSTSHVDFTQNAGAVFDRTMSILKRHHFDDVHVSDKEKKNSFSPSYACKHIRVNGGVAEMMRFHGLFRSARLMPKFIERLYDSTLGSKTARYAEVITVIPDVEQEVVALATSTKTLVAEGLLSHNSNMESVFTELGQENETFYSSIDDYVYNGGTSPTFQRVSTGALNAGDVVDLEFQYTTRSSRNDPINGITNKVDVFVDGVNPYAVTEKSVISATTLNATTTSPYYTGNFVRVGSGGAPVSGNRFMRLGSTPVISFPSTLTVGGVVYTQGTHYFLLQSTSLLAGTQLETSGIEWTAAGPSTGTELTLDYVYNQVPEILNALIASSKQITTDVLVHQGDLVYIRPCLQVEYDRSYSVATVNAAIQNRLQQYFAQLPFGSQIKLSNVTMFVQQSLGVVDVKVTTSTDNPSNYGIQLFNNSTDTVPALVETSDFKLNDSQLANYQGVLITRIAAP